MRLDIHAFQEALRVVRHADVPPAVSNCRRYAGSIRHGRPRAGRALELAHGERGGRPGVLQTQRGYGSTTMTDVRRARTVESGVRGGVRFHVRWVGEHPDLARLLLSGQDPAVQAAAATQLAERNAGFFGAVRAWHDGHVASGALRELPFDLLYALWLGPAQELARLWLAGAARQPPDRYAKALADGAWAALTARA